jgi:hypothetical protein
MAVCRVYLSQLSNICPMRCRRLFLTFTFPNVLRNRRHDILAYAFPALLHPANAGLV